MAVIVLSQLEILLDAVQHLRRDRNASITGYEDIVAVDYATVDRVLLVVEDVRC